MTFAPNTTVQWRRDVGVVRKVVAGGYAYRVEMPSGETFVCLGDVLKPAPSNVLVFKKRPPANPYGEMIEW